jgi:competence protein ComEC
MATRTIAFALGALFCHGLAVLPDPFYAGLSPLLLPMALRGAPMAVPAAFCLGIAWTMVHAHAALAGRLPAALHGAERTLVGEVTGIPRTARDRIGFHLALKSASGAGPGQARWHWQGCRVRLTWYRPAPGVRVRAGETWRVRARLRPPRGLRNPGAWDGEHRALREGTCAVGYLRERPPPARLTPAAVGLDALRERLAEGVRRRVGGLPASGLLEALAVGLRDRVTRDQRFLLQRTGTAHLMAISGLHVGLAAGAGMALGGLLARAVSVAPLIMPAGHWGALAGLAAAAGYALLAGFSVPTQRALIMVGCLLCARLLRRRNAPGDALALALLVVLLLDPLAVRDAGTWLSFAAAAGLLFALAGARAAHGVPAVARVLAGALRVQLAAALALAPLALLIFGYQSPSAPLANLLAVPVTGMLVVPLTLAGALLEPVAPEVAGPLLRLAAHAMGVLLEMLERVPGGEVLLVPGPAPGALAVFAGAAGVAALLSGAGPGIALAGLALLAPLLLPAAGAPAPGELRMLVPDVGQGLAVVLRTAGHTLVYDAGPGWGPRADAGSHVVAPALRREGVTGVDLLLVSHHHADHAGGVPGLLATVKVGRRLGEGAPTPCRAGQSWTWDGYRFEILHPDTSRPPGNDASCVLRVTGPGGSVLLPGDVEAGVERHLAGRLGAGLRAQVLVVPHHGSASSSDPAFLDAVRPRVAIVSSGHRNRFRHPAPGVVARYRERASALHDTACGGLLRVELAPGRPPVVHPWAPGGLRFWHDRDAPRHCRGAEGR